MNKSMQIEHPRPQNKQLHLVEFVPKWGGYKMRLKRNEGFHAEGTGQLHPRAV